MTNRLLRPFGRKPGPAVAAKAGKNGQKPGAVPNSQARAALELAQELLRGVEHFVLSTPDLDAPGFLDHLRRTAAELTPAIQPDELEGHRDWASDSLCAFGQLQRRYLSEREEELWRLLTLYQEHQKVDGAANKQFHDNLRGIHERMGNVVRLTDLRQVRERLENEINRAGALVAKKAEVDRERAASLAAQVQQLEQALVTARHQAMRDPLTGVYHRGAFETQLEAALRSPTGCALALIDVDDFKSINDNLGHLIGDQILKMAVQQLGILARPGEVIGRFGGDEFCFLAPGSTAARLTERFDVRHTQQTLTFRHEERHISVRLALSVGVAGSVPEDTPAAIIKRADDALLDVKRHGKGHARCAPELARKPAGAPGR
jgi:diguanylate cyclase